MHTYEGDVVAWAQEQTRLLREGRFSELDVEHIAEEIEDVGKSEQRELASRMAVLLAHLLKWQHQPGRRGASWELTIKEQRRGLKKRIKRTPSLKTVLSDEEWVSEIWSDAVAQAASEAGLSGLPESIPWTMERVLDERFLP